MKKEEILELVNSCEKECSEEFSMLDSDAFYNASKVLDAFHEEKILSIFSLPTSLYPYPVVDVKSTSLTFSSWKASSTLLAL